MIFRSSTTRYSGFSITLHWLTVLLIAGVYACVELHDLWPKGSYLRSALMRWHFMLGLSVLGLAGLRLLPRLVSPAPSIIPQPPPWQVRVARAMHAALYLVMIAMPLAGWVVLSAAGKPIPFFGTELPALIGSDRALARRVGHVHELVGNALYFLIALHALAALAHHYVVRDNTLRRMLPGGG